MRLSTSLIFTQGYDAIARQQGELFRTQQQVATGKRIVTPADDPIGAARLEVRPWVRLCIECQQADEREHGRGGARRHLTDYR